MLSRPELVNHIAATLLRTQLPIVNVPTERGQRYSGSSQEYASSSTPRGGGTFRLFRHSFLAPSYRFVAFRIALCWWDDRRSGSPHVDRFGHSGLGDKRHGRAGHSRRADGHSDPLHGVPTTFQPFDDALNYVGRI